MSLDLNVAWKFNSGALRKAFVAVLVQRRGGDGICPRTNFAFTRLTDRTSAMAIACHRTSVIVAAWP